MPAGAKLAAFAVAAVGLIFAAFVLIGAGSGSTDASSAPPTFTPRPTSTPTPVAQGLRQQAEAQHIARMSPALAELVRAQPWYREMTPAKFNLVAALTKCEQSAKNKGEPRAVLDMLSLATEQGWYGDGLDDREAAGFGGVVQAYERSLTKPDAPPVGTVLASTIRNQLFDVVTLPETGEKVVVVASADAKLGRAALELTVANLPFVEGVVGKFPYPFIYIEVTKDYPAELLGTSYDEFIGLRTTAVNTEVVVHELTHSTVYGSFPVWFEEGIAYFLGYEFTGRLPQATSEAEAHLRRIGADNKVDIINYGFYTTWDYFAETRRGFLFVKSLYDILGMEGLSPMVKQLRTKTYNDNELLQAIIAQTPVEKQNAVRKLFCDRLIGASRNYCIPGS